MSVAIGIELKSAGSAESILMQVAAGAPQEAQGTNRSDAAPSHVSSSSHPGAESFRSSMQSHLASLVDARHADGAHETETAENSLAAKLTSTARAALRGTGGKDVSSAADASRSRLSAHLQQIPALSAIFDRAESMSRSDNARSLQNVRLGNLIRVRPGVSGEGKGEEPASASAAPDPVLVSLGNIPLIMPARATSNPAAVEVPTTHIEPQQFVQSNVFSGADSSSLFSSRDSLSPNACGSLSTGESGSAVDTNSRRAGALNSVGFRSIAPGGADEPNPLAASASPIKTQAYATQQAALAGVEKPGLIDYSPAPEQAATRNAFQQSSLPSGIVEIRASDTESGHSPIDSGSLTSESAAAHQGVLPAVRTTRALDGSSDQPGELSSSEINLTAAAAQVSTSTRTRVPATPPQPEIDPGQNKIQTQPEGPPTVRVPDPAEGDLVGRAASTGVEDASYSPAVVARAAKPAAVGASKVSQVALRNSRASVIDNYHESGNHPLTVENGGQSQDSAALVRDSFAKDGPMATNGGSAGSPTGTAAGSAAHETFAALDADIRTGTPTWTHAGARHAEAGFQDPALGWVGVRADASGSSVHATLMPGSAEAAQTLGGHMAGLNSYLAEEHTHIETLTLVTPEGREAAQGAGQNAGQGMNQSAGQNHSSEQSNPEPMMPAVAADLARKQPELTSNPGRSAGIPGHESSHISVIA